MLHLVKSPPILRTLLWLAVVAARAPLPAADPAVDAPLQLARIDFERGMIEASLTPLKKHLSELALLEKQYADVKDYDGAIAARDQRRQMEKELERLDKELLLLQTRKESLAASLLPDRISLRLEDAQLKGVERQGGSLTRWTKPGASASWKLPNLPPGGYEVLLRYRCGPLEGGSVIVSEDRFSLHADMETTLRGPQEKNLGTLKITNGSGAFTIAARTVVKDNLMHLLGVQLVPASR